MSETSKTVEGEGVLEDPHREGADARMLSRAVRERWPIPGDARGKIAERLAKIAQGTGQRAVSAAKTLARMDALNQADEHADRHYERIDENKPTELLGLHDGAQVLIPGMSPPKTE